MDEVVGIDGRIDEVRGSRSHLNDSIVSVAGPDVRREVSFWTAVVLPFLSVSLLATGLDTATQRTVFLILVALNAVVLLLGSSSHLD